MTTTTARLIADRDADTDVHGAAQDIDYSHKPNRSTALLLMNEALARVRMRRVAEPIQGSRPARVVAMLAAKRRERIQPPVD
jgi:hypothetical protein